MQFHARPPIAPTLALFHLLSAACAGEEGPPSVAANTVAPEARASARPTADPGPTNEPTGDAVLLEAAVIRDPARGEMPAYRLLVPAGWTVEGGVTAVKAYHMLPFFSDFTVRAPDGRGARFWGMLEFGYADGVNARPFTPFDGRPFFPIPRSLGDYWTRAFEISPAEGVTDLEIVAEEILPEATERVREMLAPLYESTAQENRQLALTGESKEFDTDARRLVIRYDHDGERIEATLFATLRRAVYRYPNGAIRAAMWNVDHLYAVFGPAGTDPLSDPVLAAVVRSKREVPEWQETIQRWYIEKNRQIVAEGHARIAAAARAAATARTRQSQDVLDISFAGWKARNAANDAGHERSVLGIHERATYVNPGGETVDLPSHYQHVYTDGQGHYLLHDDANYEVNTDPAWNDRDWQRIEPRR